VACGVYPPVNGMQLSTVDPDLDGVSREPEHEQLPASDDPVLKPGHTRQLSIDLLIECGYMEYSIVRFGHSAQLDSPRVTRG
jgi:hypothetical protein